MVFSYLLRRERVTNLQKACQAKHLRFLDLPIRMDHTAQSISDDWESRNRIFPRGHEELGLAIISKQYEQKLVRRYGDPGGTIWRYFHGKI